MKKRTLCMLLALAIVMAPGAPALAAGDSPVRLARVEIYSEGLLYEQIDLTYYEGGQLKEEITETNYYDEAGQVIDSSHIVVSYGMDGQMEQQEITYMTGGQTVATETLEYTYDGNGELVEDVDTYTGGDSTTVTVNNYEYEYDDQGRLAYTVQYDGEEAFQSKEYTYDEAGRVATVNNRMDSYGWAYLNEYTYDDQDRVVTNRVTYDNGAPGTYWEYSYEPDAYFQLRYSLQYSEDALKPVLKPVGSTFYAEVPAGEGQPGLSFGLRNMPQLSYDEAGYLVMADAGGGSYISFTYEPAA